MANGSKDFDFSLLQRDPQREIMLNKMREKLAGNPGVVAEREQWKRKARRQWLVSMGWRGGLAALLIAANVLLFEQKDVLLSKLGYQGVPSLPAPKAALSVDDQALYWTYALYDYRKFKERFGVNGYFAVNQPDARKRLLDLMPRVGVETLGKISKYTPIVYRSIADGSTP